MRDVQTRVQRKESSPEQVHPQQGINVSASFHNNRLSILTKTTQFHFVLIPLSRSNSTQFDCLLI